MYRIFVRNISLPKEKNRTTKDVKIMGLRVTSNILLAFPIEFPCVNLVGSIGNLPSSPLPFPFLYFKQVSGYCLIRGGERDWGTGWETIMGH